MIIEAFLGMWVCFNKCFFWKTKKGAILAIFWQFLPLNFCKLSPHKFSETLLLKKIYMIRTICDHSTFFIQVKVFEESEFSEFSSQSYPLQIPHSKNLMPNLALEFSHMFQKSVYFFRSFLGKCSNYLEGTKIASFKGKRLE